MIDLNRDMTKTLAEIGLMVTLTVVMAACSHSSMTPDTLEAEVANIQVEENLDQTSQTLGEAMITSENLVTGDSVAGNVQNTTSRRHSTRHQRKHLKTVHHRKVVKKQIRQVREEDHEEKLLAASAAIVSPSIETPPAPPTLPPAPELEIPAEFSNADAAVPAGSNSNWMYIVGAGALFGLATLGWRLRRRGTPRRLILN